MPLNRAQQEAIHHGKGPAMVLAGPGSGKTLVITYRVRNLIEEYGVKPEQILVVTFTRAAAQEMEERFRRLMGGQPLPVTFGTFHSVFFRILRMAYHYSAANIIRPEQRTVILREAIREADWQPEDEAEAIGDVLGEISSVKGDRIDPANYYSQSCPDEVFRRVYAAYEQELRRTGLIDFDDMMKLVYELFSEREDILRAWQGKYRYILIDEFQDINRLQYEIVQMLAKPENHLFAVGDDDQSIYRFRGARPEIMMGFARDYPGAARILLDVNYRSVPSVVEAAGRLIAQNETRFPKQIRAEQHEDVPVLVMGYRDLATENDAVIQAVRAYHEQGIPYEDMALLYRTNAGPRVMAEQLIRINLPFFMADVMPNLYEHWIAKDVLTYMLMAAGSRSRGDFLRIINRPKRYIARQVLTDPEISFESLRKAAGGREWMEEKIDRLEYDLRMLGKMRPWAAVNYIRRGIGYEEYLKEYAEYRHIGLAELMAVLDELQESAQPFASLAEWMSHMREYSEKLQEQKEEQRRGGDGIQIRTMHGAKGLEYRVVFIMDANEDIVPHRKAQLAAEVEEERRLFYVAMTRAKSRLHICWVRERFNREMTVSRFVKETGLLREGEAGTKYRTGKDGRKTDG